MAATDVTSVDVIRILVVDDHPVMRRGLCDTLADEEDLEVVGQAADGAAAVKVARETQPEVVVMDLFMPNMDGVEACREIVELLPDVRVLMLTASTVEDDVIRAVAAGAVGFVQKVTPSAELVYTVRQVAAGELMIPPDAVRRAFRLLGDGPEARPAPGLLSVREREVLTRYATGKTYAQIAEDMEVSKMTVRNAIYRVQDKVGVGSLPEMLVWAVRNGLLDE